jgi:hypothetical protein
VPHRHRRLPHRHRRLRHLRPCPVSKAMPCHAMPTPCLSPAMPPRVFAVTTPCLPCPSPMPGAQLGHWSATSSCGTVSRPCVPSPCLEREALEEPVRDLQLPLRHQCNTELIAWPQQQQGGSSRGTSSGMRCNLSLCQLCTHKKGRIKTWQQHGKMRTSNIPPRARRAASRGPRFSPAPPAPAAPAG